MTEIRHIDVEEIYKPIHKIVVRGENVMEMKCGNGWTVSHVDVSDSPAKDIQSFWVQFERTDKKPKEQTPMREKLIDSLGAMEECAQVVEIESKSWHDFWVVERALVRAMWLVLTWIVKKEDKK